MGIYDGIGDAVVEYEAWSLDECVARDYGNDPHGGEPEWCQICDQPLCSNHITNPLHHMLDHSIEEMYALRQRLSRASEAPAKPRKPKRQHQYHATLVAGISRCQCGRIERKGV